MSTMTRREKERKEQFRNEMAESTYPKGELKPSDFIEQVNAEMIGMEVIMFVRVSSEKQNRDGNLQRQERALINAFSESGMNVRIVDLLKH